MLTAGAVRHLSWLGAVVFTIWAWGFRLSRYGLLTMCEGGGLANATIIERLG